MTIDRLRRWALVVASGALMLQVGGCDATGIFGFLQTVFLGVTAAASYAILRNL